MGSFKLGKMTLRSLFGKPATVRYPSERREPYEGMRGHVENDLDVCILCGMCERACPVGAIAVDRKAGDWVIHPFECVACARCVHECPKHCLSMGTAPTPASPELSVRKLHKDMPAKPARPARAAKPEPKPEA